MGWFDTPLLSFLSWVAETPLQTHQRRQVNRGRDLHTMQRGEQYADRVIEEWNAQRSLYGAERRQPGTEAFSGWCPPGCQCGRLP